MLPCPENSFIWLSKPDGLTSSHQAAMVCLHSFSTLQVWKFLYFILLFKHVDAKMSVWFVKSRKPTISQDPFLCWFARLHTQHRWSPQWEKPETQVLLLDLAGRREPDPPAKPGSAEALAGALVNVSHFFLVPDPAPGLSAIWNGLAFLR